MKKFKKLVWILLAILTFSACTPEDEITPGQIKLDSIKNINEQYKIEEEEITLYEINGETINFKKNYKVTGKNLEHQNDVAKHQEIWSLIKKIIPANQRGRISEFLIYNGLKSKTSGYILNRNNDLSKWRLAIAINYAYIGGFNNNGRLSYTIIHEFGHIITLNNTQIIREQNNCTTYSLMLGCSKENSYINGLFQSYWKDIWEEYKDAQNSVTAKETFYNKYKNRFPTKYASTNPMEDISETFVMFVTENKPIANTITNKKVLYLYSKSEFVALRNHIRKNLKMRGNKNNTGIVLPKLEHLKNDESFNTLRCGHKH